MATIIYATFKDAQTKNILNVVYRGIKPNKASFDPYFDLE